MPGDWQQPAAGGWLFIVFGAFFAIGIITLTKTKA